MDYTLELSDEIIILEGIIGKSGNHIRMAFSEIILISVSLDSVYKIRRAGDTAFARTNYP